MQHIRFISQMRIELEELYLTILSLEKGNLIKGKYYPISPEYFPYDLNRESKLNSEERK